MTQRTFQVVNKKTKEIVNRIVIDDNSDYDAPVNHILIEEIYGYEEIEEGTEIKIIETGNRKEIGDKYAEKISELDYVTEIRKAKN